MPPRVVPASRSRSSDRTRAASARALSVRSNVWFTLEPGGGTGEIYYPDLSTPSARALGFVVVDGAGHATRVSDVKHEVSLVDGDWLTYRQTDTDPDGHWRLVTTYVAATQRPAMRVAVRFTSLDGDAYRLYVLYEPTLANTPANDAGRTRGTTLVASDGDAASALRSDPAFTATSNGYRGTSDGWTDLREQRPDDLAVHRRACRQPRADGAHGADRPLRPPRPHPDPCLRRRLPTTRRTMPPPPRRSRSRPLRTCTASGGASTCTTYIRRRAA